MRRYNPYRRNADDNIRQLERRWQDSDEDLLAYARTLCRHGKELDAFSLLLAQNNSSHLIDQMTVDGYPSLLPANWKERREIDPDDTRFEIELSGDGWQLDDYAYANYFSCSNRDEARQALRFAKKYVDIHGDIDMSHFPLSLEEPLRYADVRFNVEWWLEEYPELSRG